MLENTGAWNDIRNSSGVSASTLMESLGIRSVPGGHFLGVQRNNPSHSFDAAKEFWSFLLNGGPGRSSTHLCRLWLSAWVVRNEHHELRANEYQISVSISDHKASTMGSTTSARFSEVRLMSDLVSILKISKVK